MPLAGIVVWSAKPDNSKTIRLKDDRGLYLEISPTGGKWWRLRYYWMAGKENRLSLGVSPADGCICGVRAWVIGSEKPRRSMPRKTGPLVNGRTASALFGIDSPLSKTSRCFWCRARWAPRSPRGSLGVARAVLCWAPDA